MGKLFLEHSVNECRDSESFVGDMACLVHDLRSNQLKLSTVDVGDLLLRVFRTLRDHKVKLDASFANVILAIMILEGNECLRIFKKVAQIIQIICNDCFKSQGLGRSLDPNMDLLWKATPYILQSKLREVYVKPKPA